MKGRRELILMSRPFIVDSYNCSFHLSVASITIHVKGSFQGRFRCDHERMSEPLMSCGRSICISDRRNGWT